jgi:transcription elongation GreA/GreB family factor
VSETSWRAEWDAVVAKGDAAKIEELWLARLEQGVGDGEAFAEALRRLRSAGKKTLASTLLEVAEEQAHGEGAWRARKRFVCELIRLGIGDGEKRRAALEECVRHVWAGRPSLEKLLKHFPLRGAKRPLETLESLETWLEHDVGGVFAMGGRGPGRVVEANPQLGMLRLDFEKERRVPVPIDAARKFLTPLPPGHFLRRRLEERDALAAEVAAAPQVALEAIVESVGTAVSVPDIKAALAGLLPEEAWTSWWNKAKKNPRLVARGSGTRVQYRLAGGGGAEEEIRAEFAGAALPQKVELARRHAARSRELSAQMGVELLAAAQGEGVDAGLAWEALGLAARTGADPVQVRAAREELIGRAGPVALVEGVGDAAQREAVLEFARELSPERWVELFASWMERESNARLLARLATALVEAGEGARVQAFLEEVFVQPTRYPAAFAWACEEGDEGLSKLLEERHTGALLVRLVELAERREFGPLRARLKAVISAGGLAGRIIQERLTAEQGRRLLQILERQGEMADERNWLRRAVTARFPELRPGAVVDVVPALSGTVHRLQSELRDLLEKQIPETLKAIREARAHGDLSENFEYHAARARQEYLSARASELQGDLSRVRIIDPARIDLSRVRVGTRVWLEPQGGGDRRTVTILGPYEAAPEKGIVSNGSEAAQGLLEREPGEAVRFDGAGWTISSIEPAS